jgi:hypothetical protein
MLANLQKRSLGKDAGTDNDELALALWSLSGAFGRRLKS